MAVPRTLFTVHITGVIIVLFLICVFLINGGITEEEIGSPLRVAQCRARCIKTVSSDYSCTWQLLFNAVFKLTCNFVCQSCNDGQYNPIVISIS